MPRKFHLDIKDSDPDLIHYQNVIEGNRFDLSTRGQTTPNSKERNPFNIVCFFNDDGFKSYLVYLIQTAKALVSHWSDENTAKIMAFMKHSIEHVDSELINDVDHSTKNYIKLISESQVDFIHLDREDHILAELPEKEETKHFKRSWVSLVDHLIDGCNLNELLSIREIKESNKIGKNNIHRKHLYAALSMHVLRFSNRCKESQPVIDTFYGGKAKDTGVDIVGRLLMAHYFLTLALGEDSVQTPDDFLWLKNSKGKNISELKTVTRDLYLKNWVYLYDKENPGAISSQKQLIRILEEHFADLNLSDSVMKRLLKKFRAEDYFHRMLVDKRTNEAHLLNPTLLRRLMLKVHIS
ncbi:TPA: hypothetical protein ACQYE6_003153 [Vibrio parahaemolyticus]|uniref:hypothetical protein n=3 Tax=Vibrio parahaemolyticus TaxID=670 RepID=UPI000415F5BB|nr:hypothetical protein [Vibrio parahaemolyticus]ELA9812994.1 hypothetical protein [Vibrio parahaemolyticus]ELA9888192.1 hypothetical protein [Vibrio parahaemolyticus]HCG8758280.1 hypothetical protein [Vibrio parahaemolyticus]HCH3499726.1 hypothetical protein [Vibrio parahaemolyticus]